MSNIPGFNMDSQWILTRRGSKNPIDPFKPYGYFNEKERTPSGSIEDVSTILLVNNECPFHCLMCDLWKNTTDEPVPAGAIPEQIKFALSRLNPTKHLKLYNSGSFFDPRAIAISDYEEIASRLQGFETVIVESRPNFINENSLLFNKLLKPELQVAIGLETVHPQVLQELNKKMTLDNFEKSVSFLRSNGISTRAFVLLRPPFLSETEGVIWAKKSIDFAFETGVSSCIIIPVRAGNGALEDLASTGCFESPDIKSLEDVVEYGIRLKKGLVFSDLWDIDNFIKCKKCKEARKNRLLSMNLNQLPVAPISCSCSN